jgi:hypothetical protein
VADQSAGVPALPAGSGPARPQRRSPWRRWWWIWALIPVGLAGIALVILAVVASRYEPLGFGSLSNSAEAFPGLPTGQGIHEVNTVGGLHEDVYIPPQRGTFSLFADVANNGTHPVTITAVRLPAGSPISLAGPVRYSYMGMGPNPDNEMPPPASRVLHSVVLQPGEQLFLGFPVHMWPCGQKDGWMSLSEFDVTMKYLSFAHTVALPWGMRDDSLIMLPNGGTPGQKDTVCAPGTTKANLPKTGPDSEGPTAVAGSIIRVDKGGDTGELRLMEMNAPDAATNLTGKVPACLQASGARPATYRMANFDLNWAGINVGQRGPAPAVRLSITGPGGQPMIAADWQGAVGGRVGCRAVLSLSLGQQGKGWQLVYGLAMRAPRHGALTSLRVTIDGNAITVPLVPACPLESDGSGDSDGSACFDGTELGGDWTAGTPYSVSVNG